MNTHEQLKEICEKISYEPKFYYDNLIWFHRRFSNLTKQKINEREIIFTNEFMNKYYDYLRDKKDFWNPTIIIYWLFENLDKPVEYLYNLIK
jgi:hypothetical protein